MASNSDNLPAAGAGKCPDLPSGRKPKMKECHTVDEKGRVDWERTQKDFPVHPDRRDR